MYIQVQLRKSGANEYGGRPYTYKTDLPVSIGNIVIAPTVSGLNYGKVVAVNVPYDSLDPAWRDRLKEIVDFAPQPTETPDEIEALFSEG